jgi:hypothetical protein
MYNTPRDKLNINKPKTSELNISKLNNSDLFAVMNIINKYKLDKIGIQRIGEYNDSLYSLAINKNSVERITRTERNGLMSNKTIKLQDELLMYPNVELVFEFYVYYPGDSALYYNIGIKILPLDEWMQCSVLNREIYTLISNDKQYRSSFNHNWLLIPSNFKLAMNLHSSIKKLSSE